LDGWINSFYFSQERIKIKKKLLPLFGKAPETFEQIFYEKINSQENALNENIGKIYTEKSGKYSKAIF